MHSRDQYPGFASGDASLSKRIHPHPSSPNEVSRSPRLRSVESAKLIEHQMYFWGRDVLHPNGNLLCAAGFQGFRRADCPHKVRCYSLKIPLGEITLHSTGVSFQTGNGSPGVIYLRPTHRLYHFEKGAILLPFQRNELDSLRRLLPNEFPPALTTLLAFVHAYEQWAGNQGLPESRLNAWREQKSSASKGIRWLKPADSRRWLEACLDARQAADPNQYTTPESFSFPQRKVSQRKS